MRVLWSLFGLVMAGAAVGAEADWRTVNGKELPALLAGRELGDGVHYAYRFHGDGRLIGMDMGRPVVGTWKTVDRSLCWALSRPKGNEECYSVQRKGSEVRMLRDSYEAFSGTLTVIEPMSPQDRFP